MKVISTKFTYLNTSTNKTYSKSFNNLQLSRGLHRLPLLTKSHQIISFEKFDSTEDLILRADAISKNIGLECVIMNDGTIYTSRDIEGCGDLVNVDDIVYSSYE